MNGWGPIPEVGEVVATTEIRECSDALVAVQPTARIKYHPAYYEQGIRSASSALFVRVGAWNALRLAASLLPEGLSILVLDGLRTLDTQRAIGDRLTMIAASEGSGGTEEASNPLYVYPAPESEAEYRYAPPPHSTGGAVDVTLADEAGAPLDLGADFDQFDQTAWLRHLEGADPSRESDVSARQRDLRRTLYWAMLGGGFAPYRWEFWHFEFGTRHAASFLGHPHAIYGPALPYRAIREMS